MAEFIDQIIGDQLASFSQEAFSGYESALPIYLHRLASQEEVYGGFALPQWIETVAMDAQLLEWLLASLWQLDQIIALDFYFYDHNNGSLIDLYLDTEIQIEQSSLVLGLATPNLYVSPDPAEPYEGRWWEIFINTPEFVHDSGQLKYALLHELGHAFGLEHPFDSSDGDAWGVEGGDPNGDVTVMSYTPPPEGWPSAFRPLDLAALATLWGLEPDHTDGWLFRSADQSDQILSSDDALNRLHGSDSAVHLIGPVVLPVHGSSVPDVRLVPQQLVDSAVASEDLLIPQGLHQTVFYAFDPRLDGDVLLVEAYERAIRQLDQAIEIDFQQLDDPASPLVQVLLSREMLPVNQLDAGDFVAVERHVASSEFHLSQPQRTTVLLDPLNPYYRHQSSFADLNTALEFAALQGLLMAAGLSLPVPAVEIAPDQSLLGSRFDSELSAVQLPALDLQSLALAYGPETSSGSNLDPSLSTVSIVDAAVDVSDADGLSHLTLTFEREGSLDLAAAVLVQPSVTPAAAVEVAPALEPQPLLFGPLQQQASLDWSFPSGAVDVLDLELLSPWQVLLALESDSIDIHAAELSVEPLHLVDHRPDLGLVRPTLQSQGSELLFWSADLSADSLWQDFLDGAVEQIDQAIDLDFYRVPSDHPLAQLQIMESEHPSVEGTWHQSELITPGSTHALPPHFQLVVPTLAPESALQVVQQRVVVQQLLLALGLELPTDFSDGDGYELTAVYPRDSALFTHLDVDEELYGLLPLDATALALVHGNEDDHSSGADPLRGEAVVELVPSLSMQLDAERSGLNAQEDALLVWLDLERHDNWQLESQALVEWRLDGVLQPDLPLTMAVGQSSQSLQLAIPRLVDEVQISIYPIKGLTGSSDTLLLDASQWSTWTSRSASSADASPPSSVFLLDHLVPESMAVGALVTTIGSSDPDADGSFSYALVPGDGADDNHLFSIVGDHLLLAKPLDFESQSDYHLRVRSTDSSGRFLERSLQLMVDDVAELMLQSDVELPVLSFAPHSELSFEPQFRSLHNELFLDQSHQLLLHYNSKDLIVLGDESLQPDVFDLDGDPLTDAYVTRNIDPAVSSSPHEWSPPLGPLTVRLLLDRFDPLTGQPSVATLNYSVLTPGLSTSTAAGSDQLTAFNLDVDGDGAVTALGDGLMIIRKLFGDAFAGDALTDKAMNAAGATRSREQIHSFIQQGIDQGALDLDGDGRTSALGDGLMLIRRLFGHAFEGQALIDQALHSGSPLFASLDAPERIAAHVDGLIAPALR